MVDHAAIGIKYQVEACMVIFDPNADIQSISFKVFYLNLFVIRFNFGIMSEDYITRGKAGDSKS
jgi:hypothetical protein